MNDDRQRNLLHQLLPPELMPDDVVEDVFEYFRENFGEPEEQPGDGDVDRYSFQLKDRRVDLFRSRTTLALIGGAVFLQLAPPPPPCPVPGPAGVTFTPRATGSDNYTILFAQAASIALGRAVADFFANYGPLRAIACGVCPPPCVCTTPLAGVPTITQTITVARRFLGVPVRFTVTVNLNITFSVVCV